MVYRLLLCNIMLEVTVMVSVAIMIVHVAREVSLTTSHWTMSRQARGCN